MLLSVVLPTFIASAQTDPALLRFVHPDAKALISIDWKRVRQSHLGTMIREKWIDGSPGGAIPGVEFLDDIDRFVISSPGRNPIFGSTEEAPMLVVVAGHFDLATCSVPCGGETSLQPEPRGPLMEGPAFEPRASPNEADLFASCRGLTPNPWERRPSKP